MFKSRRWRRSAEVNRVDEMKDVLYGEAKNMLIDGYT
jgi:hypothetical protein